MQRHLLVVLAATAFLHFTSELCAKELIVEVRETAGVARELAPVVVKGVFLLNSWVRGIADTRTLRLADDQGHAVPLQIDERDSGQAYALQPNHRLDANDELVWQCTLAPGQTREYRLFTVGTADSAKPAAATDLWVGPNPTPQQYSATLVARNTDMEIGVRGWPVDKTKWSGCGAGCITEFKLFGQDQIAQGEGHTFILNANPLDARMDTLEIAASGPVRVILQARGKPFNPRPDLTGAESANATAVRTYALYNSIPWLEVRETVRSPQLLPGYHQQTRIYWRPGGRPFDLGTTLWLPGKDGTPVGFTYAGEKNGDTRTFPEESWFCALRPGNRGVPAFFFPPASPWRNSETWRAWAAVVEPWMKNGFDEAKQFDAVKCVADVALCDGRSGYSGEASWQWAVLGTRAETPAAVREQYRAWVLRPLHNSLGIREVESAWLFDKTNAIWDPGQIRVNAMVKSLDLRQEGLWTDSQQIWAPYFPKFRKRFASSFPQTVADVQQEVAERSAVVRYLKNGYAGWKSAEWPTRASLWDRYYRWFAQPSPTISRLSWWQYVTLARGSVPGLKKNLGNVDNGYCVYPTHNCTKLHAKHIGYVHAEEPVEMTAARREGESIQLGIVPLLQPLRQVQVEISDLTGSGKATIPASAWTRFRVGDVAAPAGVNEFYGMPAGTRWPDPLLPYEPFDCPGDEMRAVLLTLNVPADAVPGDYTGTITVAPAEKKPTTVPVKVHVFNFTLPERRTLLWDSWYDMDTVGRYYGYGPETDLEHFTRNMEMLARYRAVPGLYGWVVLAKNVAVWREADGRFTFDFSKYDRWIEITQRYGNLWNPNGSCNSGWLAIFSSPGLGNIVHDRQTGKPLTLKELPEKSAVDPNFTLIYEKFMQAYVTHLKEKGWLATAWHEAWDEPVRERVEPCKQHHAYLMKIVPELHQFAWGLRPMTDAWAHEVTQAWAPNLGAWYEEFPGIEAARKEGKTCFFYTCGADYPNPDPARTRPDISIWDPNIQRRAYPWVFDKIGADGMLIFMMNGWGDANEKNGKNPATRWPRSDWTVEDRNTFWLVYPAPDGSLWPSLRLDALRDGFEDYEYLTAARALVKAHPENKEAAARLAAITSPVTTREFYELDPSAYDQRKQELGRIIEAFGTK